jgi:hypothetical protein
VREKSESSVSLSETTLPTPAKEEMTCRTALPADERAVMLQVVLLPTELQERMVRAFLKTCDGVVWSSQEVGAFSVLVQSASEGALTALQVPSHWTVPFARMPQLFAAVEKQALPNPELPFA